MVMLEASVQTMNDFFAFISKRKEKSVGERIKTQTCK
jgi:hypothetical protein